uniref:ATP synthase F(0) complex subunit f, mitochondrial n=1 Tax=Eptatretus burgeri TaxID=7764 RepID=A0A8C4QJZ6_EPTBU
MANKPVLAEQRLLDVKLGDLPPWFAKADYTPKGVLGAFRRGYQRYFNKYINVKRGGLPGISMILTAYVVVSYYFVYDNTKHDMWRKHH